MRESNAGKAALRVAGGEEYYYKKKKEYRRAQKDNAAIQAFSAAETLSAGSFSAPEGYFSRVPSTAECRPSTAALA